LLDVFVDVLIYEMILCSDVQNAQKAISREIRPTAEHFWTDVCDNTCSVKGQNVDPQAQVPSFQDALKTFRFIYPS